MDTLLLGETLVAENTVGATISYPGFWLSSAADELVGAVDVTILSDTTSWALWVETKNSEDADSAATTLGSQSITSTGITKVGCVGAKELVRYVIRVSTDDASHIHLQMMWPQWVPN